MSRLRTQELTEVDQSEGFRPYSREVRRRYYVLNVPLGLVLFAVYWAYWSQYFMKGHEKALVWLLSLFALALPVYSVYEFTYKRRTAFSATGVAIDRLPVIPWQRVAGIERTPVRLWLVRTAHERLSIRIVPERAIKVTGAWSLLRLVQQVLAPKPQEFTHFLHPPEAIDQIIAAMEKYSGRDFH